MQKFIQKFLPMAVAAMLFSVSAHAEMTGKHEVVTTYINAYNQKDIEQMSSLMHPDIEWIDIAGSTQTVSVSGKQAMLQGLAAYFATDLESVSVLQGAAVNGPYVSGVEKVLWVDTDNQERQQSATVVYELEDGLIRRVWYFPAVK
ncbi:nuclear transport factor 2 family protein [Parvularcula sp. IMCC14364]|uniref:nuclear transport factor 2 family protein n=1 Tax=Parvularcula sp. IMCC14364 TaxID=3067902 RepID=UPI002740AFE5|nr:nuclear transport factor 2 family protein [Parvularcula sp. IMCC14364]